MTKGLIAILLLACACGAWAQAPSPEPGVAQVRELLSLAGAEKQYEQVMTLMMGSIKGGFSQGFADAVREKTLDAEKRRRAQEIAERHMQEVLGEYAAEIRRIMPYEALVNEVYAPLYRKLFTSAELADIIAFYKSPSGSKFAAAAPQLMQDSMREVTTRYMPRLNRRMNELMRERMRRMAEEIGKL